MASSPARAGAGASRQDAHFLYLVAPLLFNSRATHNRTPKEYLPLSVRFTYLSAYLCSPIAVALDKTDRLPSHLSQPVSEMPPARPTKSPPPQRPKGTPSKAAGKAKAGKATAASVAASESDDEVDSEPAAANGQASSSASSKSPAKAAAKGSKAPSAVKAKAAAAAPSAPAAKAAPATIGAVLVLFLALAAGAYTVLAPGKLKPVPKLGPNAFDGLNLKLSGGHTGMAMVGFT